jgi:triosephosphate isomerase
LEDIMRRPIIAGNWKMNKTPAEAAELVKTLVPLVADAEAEVVVCPPFVCLEAVRKVIEGTNIKLGAQNVHFEKSGAFTGEISADMLLAMGVEYVIIGHSERRQYFGETDCTVNKRARAALAAGLKPIICVGESLAERENGITDELVGMQTKLALKEIDAAQLEQLVIAYEPIWAIGTGKTATAQEANATIGAIRKAIAQVYGEDAAQKVRIQYGGSMNPKNASELMAQSEIDGGLIGGASLKAEDFSKVVKY